MLNEGQSSSTNTETLEQELTNQEIISLETEIPESLFGSMQGFLKSNPQWDQYQLMSSALASFLFQNGSRDRAVSQHYLNGLFSRSAAVAGN